MPEWLPLYLPDQSGEPMNEPPYPACLLGYPDFQLKGVMGNRLGEFLTWLGDSPMAMCDNLSGCGDHGAVTYTSDVHRFLLGMSVRDR